MPTKTHARVLFILVAACGLIAACSGSAQRDQYYGTEAGSGFDAPRGTGGARGGAGGGGGQAGSTGGSRGGNGGDDGSGGGGGLGGSGSDAGVGEQDSGP